MTEPDTNRSRLGLRRFPVLTSLAVFLGAVALCTAAHALSIAWTRTTDGSGTVLDRDAGLHTVVAPNGDPYVVGRVTVDGENDNIWIRKYNASGAKLWSRNVNGPANKWDEARGAAVDSTGNLYVVGFVSVTGESENIWIRKYSPTGAKRWTRKVNGPANDEDMANAVVVDSADNVYVAGYIWVTGQRRNVWIRKYDSTGSKLWTRTVNGPDSSDDGAYGAAVDADDNLYVVGYRTTTDEDDNIWIRKYDSSGRKLWTRTVDGPGGGGDSADGSAVDADGDLFVVGHVSTSGGLRDIWIRKYSAVGGKKWTKTIGGAAGDQDWAMSVAVDDKGAAYVTGVIKPVSNSVAWLRKYSSAGEKRWTTTYAGPLDNAGGMGVAVNADRRIYVTGYVGIPMQGSNAWVRKYAQ